MPNPHPRKRFNLRGRAKKDVGYLPRPALGRRPWLAFLRRARMRRRFAFAMTGERTRARRRCDPTTLRLVATGWQSPPLRLVRSRPERLRGLAPIPGPVGILMRTRSVHGFGLRLEVEFVALDSVGVVVRAGTLRPRRIAHCRGAAWIAELPAGTALPLVGTAVAVDRLVSWSAR